LPVAVSTFLLCSYPSLIEESFGIRIMSRQFLRLGSRSFLAPSLRLTTPFVRNSCITTSNQLRTFQSSSRKDLQYTTTKMSGTQPASGGEHRDFSRDALFDLSGKVALVTGT